MLFFLMQKIVGDYGPDRDGLNAGGFWVVREANDAQRCLALAKEGRGLGYVRLD